MNKLVLFDYREGRGREGPKDILKDFKGYLQTDGYAAYEDFAVAEGITLLHCMAHARRKFHEALDNDEQRANYALEQIQKIYIIERICKENQLNFAELKEVRQKKSIPILRDLGLWLQQQYVQVLPKSVENSIRLIALGRKNYLFAGSHEAAKRSGMLYSLLGTCKMHGIEPYTWLKEVLSKIADHPVKRVHELLPHLYGK